MTAVNEIIEDLKKAYASDATLGENSTFYYKANYPVKIVHETTRVQDEKLLQTLVSEGFFDENGFSKSSFSEKDIQFLTLNAAKQIQNVSYVVSQTRFSGNYTFQEKFPHDRWKKIRNTDNLNAVISITAFSSEKDICKIETQLRNIMRSNKEVPALKPIGFVWLAKVPKSVDITPIMQHYFLQNYISFEKNEEQIYIGWNKRLQDINMRYFVCQPK